MQKDFEEMRSSYEEPGEVESSFSWGNILTAC